MKKIMKTSMMLAASFAAIAMFAPAQAAYDEDDISLASIRNVPTTTAGHKSNLDFETPIAWTDVPTGETCTLWPDGKQVGHGMLAETLGIKKVFGNDSVVPMNVDFMTSVQAEIYAVVVTMVNGDKLDKKLTF